jgi:hypothetical protein
VILALFVVGFFIFIMMSGVQSIQEAFNPQLEASNWMDTAHFNIFNVAASFVTYIWVFFIVFLVFGLAYWSWVYTQRQRG